jgi:hypothetical protein
MSAEEIRFRKLNKEFKEFKTKEGHTDESDMFYLFKMQLQLNSALNSLNSVNDMSHHGGVYNLAQTKETLVESDHFSVINSRLLALESEVESVVKTEAEVIGEIKVAVQDMEATANDLKVASEAIIDTRKTLSELIADESMERIIDKAVEYSDYAFDTAKDHASSWGLIPEFGAIGTTVTDLALDHAKLVAKDLIKEQLPKLPLINKMYKGSIGVMNSLLSIVLDGKDLQLKNDALALANNSIATEALRSASMIQKLKSHNAEELAAIEEIFPVWSYYLVPLVGTGGLDSASDLYSRALDGLATFASKDVFGTTSLIPMHSFIVVRYHISIVNDVETALQVTFSAGDYRVDSKESVVDVFKGLLLNKGIGNQVGFSFKVMQRDITLESDWTIIAEKNSGSSGTPDYKHARLVEKGIFPCPSNELMCFIELMRIHDKTNFNILTHNCQVMSKRLLRFFLQREKPHWMNDKMAARILASRAETLTIPGVDGPDFEIPRGGYPIGNDHTHAEVGSIQDDLTDGWNDMETKISNIDLAYLHTETDDLFASAGPNGVSIQNTNTIPIGGERKHVL